MSTIAFRGLLSRKLRTVLTMIAIILGVSMIAGTYILTDTINNSFSQIFHTADRTIDVVITSKTPVESQFTPPPPFPASLLSVVQGTPGVAAAEGEIADQAHIFDPQGNELGGTGAPTLLFSRPTITHLRTLILIKGHEPHGNEFMVDEGNASKHNMKLGEQFGIVAVRPLEKFTLVGITRFGNVSSIGGAILLSFDLPTAQRITGKEGKYDQISVLAQPGVSPAELVQRIQARIPPSLLELVKVQTASAEADAQTQAIQNGFLNILTYALLAFGGIAVFVGAFIIFNTFSITVAQRTREFGMLRTIGAMRAQILRSVILEALLIGLVASILGLLAGLGIAQALNGLFKSFGADLPNSGTVVETRTIIVGLVVGTLVTLLASLMPAIRATRVPPIAALREGAQLPRGRLARYTPYIAALVTLLGIGAMVLGIFADISSAGQRLLLIGLGALLLFLGVAMLSPRLVGPLANLIGWPIDRLTNITGRLARENATRNPGRTAVTAAALMVGLALVGFVTIFAAELRQTVNDAVNRELVGTFAIYNTRTFIPEGVGPAVARVEGVQAVTALKTDNAKIDGIGKVSTNGIQPRSLSALYRVQWKQGSAATLFRMGPYDAIISDTFATDHTLAVGSSLHVTTPTNTHRVFRVIGIYKSAVFLPNWSIPYNTMRRDWGLSQDNIVIVLAAPGQDLTKLENRIKALLKAEFPVAQVYSEQEIKNQQDQSITQLLNLIYVLLALSVLVSLFGIINTLVLSVYERTREIGLLRAVGTTRRQVRWMIRWESVITSVIGAILGLALGIVFALLITRGLASQNIEYTIPVGQLLIWVLFAILFGIVAAAFPARRAAKLDVLQAVSYE